MIRNVLITGGAGFIGSYTALNLMKTGKEVTILDNFLPQIHGDDWEASPTFAKLKGANVRIIHGDVRDPAKWDEALKGQDALIHLAAETGTGQSMYEIARYSEVNVQGTAVMLDKLANTKHTIKRMMIASSRSIYGEGKYRCEEHGVVYPDARRAEEMKHGDFAVKCPQCGRDAEVLATDEEAMLKPSSVYAISKVTQEQMMLVVGRAIGVPAVALRYQNVFGPGQSLVNPYTGILSIFSGVLFDGGELNIFEDGLEMRDFVFIEDVAEVNVRAIESEGAAYKVINVGTGVGTSVIDVANALMRAYGIEGKLRISGDFRLGDIRHNFAEIKKLKQYLGYAPRYDFARGIARFAEWVKSRRDQLGAGSSRYQASLREMREKKLMS